MIIQIDEHLTGKRADVIVAEHNPAYSRAALVKLFGMGCILIDSTPAKPGDKPKIGSTLHVDMSPLERQPDVIPLPILYEDENVVVINKPEGIISHSRGRYWHEASVASFIRDKTKDLEGDRAGIVHRLDRATSGVMIAAKTASAMQYLQRQFSSRKVEKEYIALVHGQPSHEQAKIIAPIARNPVNPKFFYVAPDGKPAETLYTIQTAGKRFTQLHLKPTTGRTHQLRVHMQYIGHPIVGDILYGSSSDTQEKRMYLHAWRLTIHVPGGEQRTFEAPIPDVFKARLMQ